MGTLSDEALLAGLASGDADDAAAFVRRFQRRVYGLAWTILRDDDLADDVAQETFVRAWRHAGGYDPPRDRVRDALAALPDEQRRALVLAVYAGRTAREISEMDGVPLGTVKTRIRTAMFSLRETLGVVHDV